MPETPSRATPRAERTGLPLSPPTGKKQAKPARPGAPDLHIEEIEEKHIPKDRNVFDK